MQKNFHTIAEAVQALKAGQMILLMDNAKRENEADLVTPAELVTPEHINVMVTDARGIVCLALEAERCDHLNLPLQPTRNRGPLACAFTVSIEASEGVTTGVSAADRAKTIRDAVAPDAVADDLSTPGHVYPLRAAPGGVLARQGHTEASIELVRRSGFSPAAVICEVMNKDGSMARYDDVMTMAKARGWVCVSVDDLLKVVQEETV